MSASSSQPLLISLESKVPAGPPSSTSSSSSSSFATENATTGAMRSATTVSSSASNYEFSNAFRRQQFSPYPPHSSRRCTISGDTRQHNHRHSPPTSSVLLDRLSSPYRSSLMYHPNPPSSNSPSPSIAPSVLLPEGSPSMATSSYYYQVSSSSVLDNPDDYMSMFPVPSDPAHPAQPRAYRDLPPPYSMPPPSAPSISLNPHAREKELEEEIKGLQGRIRSLESMLASTQGNGGGSNTTNNNTGNHSPRDNQLRLSLPCNNGPFFSFNPALGPAPSDWDARTRTRERIFCALNRAGNALCAWHDSRRERRVHPPRMAPPRTLNCGCSYEQALFEESLARNGVGNYWPGDSVRMDPVLRNALLALLEQKFNYRDGDFERNPDGTWKEGQDAAAWEEKSLRPLRRER